MAGTDKVGKGVHLPVTDIAKASAGEKDMCLFHTRLASCGGIKDELCHPFVVEGDGGKFVVMHNGHWSDWHNYSEKDEQSDTQTMANLVAKYGLGVLLSWAAKSSGVWLVYDRDDKKTYAIRRSGTFYLQRLNRRTEDKDETPAFFHASEPLQAISGWRRTCAQINEDVFYELRLSGRARERRAIERVTPDRKTWTYTTSYYGYDADTAWREMDWLHDDAYGVNGKIWSCACRQNRTCSKCEDHEKKFGVIPLYDDDGELFYGSLTDQERVLWGMPTKEEGDTRSAYQKRESARKKRLREEAAAAKEKEASDEATTKDAAKAPKALPPAAVDHEEACGETLDKVEKRLREVVHKSKEKVDAKSNGNGKITVLPKKSGKRGQGYECRTPGCTNRTYRLYCEDCQGDRTAPSGMKWTNCFVCDDRVCCAIHIVDYVCHLCRMDLADVALYDEDGAVRTSALIPEEWESHQRYQTPKDGVDYEGVPFMSDDGVPILLWGGVL